MELEKEKTHNIELSSQEEYTQKLLEKINILDNEISENNNSHKQKLSSKICDTIHAISELGLCASFIVSAAIVSAAFVGILIAFFEGGFNNVNFNFLFKILISNFILITSSTILYHIFTPTLFNKKDVIYKKSLIGNIKNKIKNKFFKQLFSKNTPLLIEKIDIENKFNSQFDEKFINNIYSFYENNNYRFGTKEHLKLTKNFNKIQELQDINFYTAMFSLYIKDKYEYYESNIQKVHLSEKL